MTAALAELPRVHGRHRDRALAAARRVKAVELKTAGLTYAQVAQELGYTSRGTAYNVVTKALREQTVAAVTDLRDLENARLDALQLALWDAAMTGDINAAVVIVKIVKARVHLNGLSSPRSHSSAFDSANIGRSPNRLT
jgi:orotate phosphoribosyltransferase-like protein